MYNRYIPQPDGSYRRSFHPDRTPQPRQAPRQHRDARPEPAVQEPCPPPKKEPAEHCPPENEEVRQAHQDHTVHSKNPQGQNVLQFFRQLLPKDFDTADLLIILLLLLMAGDSQEDQNNALLTLALYLFM